MVDGPCFLKVCFLVRVEWGFLFRWEAFKRPFLMVRFVVLACLTYLSSADPSFRAALFAPTRALWKLNWFLRDFGYDMELLLGIRSMRRL